MTFLRRLAALSEQVDEQLHELGKGDVLDDSKRSETQQFSVYARMTIFHLSSAKTLKTTLKAPFTRVCREGERNALRCRE
ncbi:MAG: hypothetical protein KAI83_06035 [Thiomargarita sp.]|nr:hypothetical protein [Thiomargarita sp.]